MGYSADAEIPGDMSDTGYGMTNGYTGEYIVTSAVANGMDASQQYDNNAAGVDTSSHAPMLTYASHYAPAAPMITTVPYCAPLVADPYIVQHDGVSYPHQVIKAVMLTRPEHSRPRPQSQGHPIMQRITIKSNEILFFFQVLLQSHDCPL